MKLESIVTKLKELIDGNSKGVTEAQAAIETLISYGSWKPKIYAGSTELTHTTIFSQCIRIGKFVFAEYRGTLTSQANGGIYISGAPGLNGTHRAIGSIFIDSQSCVAYHTGGDMVYARNTADSNAPGNSVKGKTIIITLAYLTD